MSSIWLFASARTFSLTSSKQNPGAAGDQIVSLLLRGLWPPTQANAFRDRAVDQIRFGRLFKNLIERGIHRLLINLLEL
jgi:predicted oxidoreductase